MKYKILNIVAKKYSFFLLYFILYTLYLTLIPTPVFAHVLKTDGNIGAVIHIDPEDDPIVGQPANFYFEFKDRENKFKPENCSCLFSVSENGKELFSQPLFQNNTDPSTASGSVNYTFPQRDIYQVKITGTPKVVGAFQSFSLSYDIRVEREANASPQNGQLANNATFSLHWWHFLLVAIVGAGVVFLVFKRK